MLANRDGGVVVHPRVAVRIADRPSVRSHTRIVCRAATIQDDRSAGAERSADRNSGDWRDGIPRGKEEGEAWGRPDGVRDSRLAVGSERDGHRRIAAAPKDIVNAHASRGLDASVR